MARAEATSSSPWGSVKALYAVNTRFAGGGIGTTSYHAVRGLQRAGVLERLVVNSFRASEIVPSRLKALGLPGRALLKAGSLDPTFRLFYVADLLFDLWARSHLLPCDLFHGWSGQGLLSLRRAKELGAVTVLERPSSHTLTQQAILEGEYQRFGLSSRPLPLPMVRRQLQEYEEADYVLVPSSFAYESFLAQGFPPERLRCLPFGVDCQRFHPVTRPPGAFRVLFVGQISLRKGIAYLLEAWSGLRLKGAELLLVGRVHADGAAALRRYDLANVRLLGHQPDPVSLYQSASVFLFPTLEEGSALVTYEALACGLPVVTTPHAGSVVRDGVEGYLVPVRDVRALQERILVLFEDAEHCQRLGEAARRRAAEYPWERYGEQLVALYRELLGLKAMKREEP